MPKAIDRLDNAKKDCFSYDEKTRLCSQLESSDCKGCSFYKTRRQYHEDRARARDILRAKGDIRLVDKYI